MGRLASVQVWGRYRDHLLDRRRRPRTIKLYRQTLFHYWAFLAQRRKQWWQATPADLAAYLERPGRTGRVSTNTRHSDSVVILAFYRWARAERLTRTNRLAKVLPAPGARPVPRVLDLAQVDRLLDHVAADERLTVMVWLAYGLGLRAGEIAAARIEDVRLGDRAVFHVREEGAKGGRARVVPVPPLVRPVLEDWLSGLPRAGPLVSARDMQGRPTWRHLRWESVSAILADAMRGAGLAETGHALRHTMATLILAAGKGTNLRAVSRILGHANTAVTEQVYTFTWDGDADAAAALLPDPRR